MSERTAKLFAEQYIRAAGCSRDETNDGNVGFHVFPHIIYYYLICIAMIGIYRKTKTRRDNAKKEQQRNIIRRRGSLANTRADVCSTEKIISRIPPLRAVYLSHSISLTSPTNWNTTLTHVKMRSTDVCVCIQYIYT